MITKGTNAMISCTEFIPSYSELFAFIEEKHGFAEVQRYWDDIFNPDRNGILTRKLREFGLRGCWEYWSYSLNEEAADFVMMYDEKGGWYYNEMRFCPSKGRLLGFTHIKPYDKYCLHCDLYRKAVERFGLCYQYDFTRVDKAACQMLIYDPDKFNGKMIITPDTLIMDRTASDNKYLHREFHNYMSMGVDYLGRNFGDAEVEEYLTRFTRNFYAHEIDKMRGKGFEPLAEFIRHTYHLEEAEDALHIDINDHEMRVSVDYCPAVAFLKKAGWTPSKWFYCTTKTVMEVIARELNLNFEWLSYNEENGQAEYRFSK